MNPKQNITLLITRHGFVNNPQDILYYRHVNVPLSSAGHKQMQEVGKKIKNRNFNPSRIYTSILLRAIESSAEIAKSFPGIKIVKMENLQDPYAPGIQTKSNSWLAEIEMQGHDVYSHPDLTDVIEPREDVGKRMRDVINEIIKKHPGETVIVLSHGDTIALLKEKLRKPDKKLPSIAEIKKNGHYPEKGAVWCVVLNANGKILKESVI